MATTNPAMSVLGRLGENLEGDHTILRETLDDRTDDHDDRTIHDGASTSKPSIDYRNKRQRENSSKRVRRGDDALE